MPLTIDDLTEEEKLDYWNRLETYARRGRENLIAEKRLHERMRANGVTTASIDEVIAKENSRRGAEHGAEPTPDGVRTDRQDQS